MRARPFDTIFSRALTLTLSGIVATLMLGLGILAASPPPPPRSVSVAWYVRAYRTGHDPEIASSVTMAPPSKDGSSGPAEALIAASLAGGVDARVNDVRVAIQSPLSLGVVSGRIEDGRSHMTIIDVSKSTSLPRRGRHPDLRGYLRDETIRVPPFDASIRRLDGRYVRLSPRSVFPTAWQARIAIIFFLSLTTTAPLAWIGARRLSASVDLLAQRIDSAQGHEREVTLPATSGTREIRRLESAFAALNERTQRHVAERTRLLLGVVHDLRTPLTTMRVRVEETGEPVRTRLLGDIARIDLMTTDIMAFAQSSGRQGPRQPVDLGSLVAEVVDGARISGAVTTLDEGSIGPADPAFVSGSPAELTRAIDNLIRNAHRYGTRVTVSIRTRMEDVAVMVRDDGPGVPDQFLTRLTEPFFRVERDDLAAADGFGLGLATVDAVVRSHGGSVTFRNLTGGFMAMIVLPRTGGGG